MRKPKILVVENGVNITGAFMAIARSCDGLKDDFEFCFLLPTNSRAKSFLEAKAYAVFEMPMKEIRKDFLSIVSYFPTLIINLIRFFQLMRRLKVDLVVSNDFYNLLPSMYKRFGGTRPYVVFVRFMPSKFPALLVKFWCFWHKHFAAATVAVSEAVKKELPYQQRVVCVGGELPAFEKIYKPSSSKTILYVANFIQGKGQEYALRSFALFGKQYPDWNLRFVGGDMGLTKNKVFREQLKSESIQLGIADQVTWMDFVDDISSEYEAASFALNFSESESFSMTCLESMFYGRAVIATECGGPSEIIENSSTGILVPVKQITRMATAMEYMILHPTERNEMSEKAYRSVREKFSHKNTIEKLGDVYHSALLK